MMKTIDLVRHATAMENYGNQKDIDRELTAGGIRHAVILGKYLNSTGMVPQKIITSNAQRAKHTAMLLADCMHFNEDDIIVNDDLYNASIRVLLSAINQLEDDCDHIMMVAHNPGISYLVEYLTNEQVGSMFPGSICRLTFEGNWSAISQNSCSLVHYQEPESLIT
jgi:phosphohistidine phosphatase